MSNPNSRAEEIFAAAQDLADPAQRRAYLDHTCAGNDALRHEVESLLAAAQGGDSFLETPAAEALGAEPPPALAGLLDAAKADAPVAAEKPGARIGRYKLLEKIGEGGFGEVWMAEQEEPVRRRVALKVIKLGMDTKQVVARFEAERQALALMDHPNIAQVFDGGATETGRPYFVMELVRGIRITDYCDEKQLPVAERLELFGKVCHAVQHAHQKGIIHRDLKPSNILVTLHDGVPVPKVIDFGIAKATGGRLTDKTFFTGLFQFIGTPAYISPEQAEMSGLDVDTRSDIYSLGVLLYELLTGRTPLDAEELVKAGLDALRRAIREQEPLRPSMRLHSLVATEQTTTAKRRRTEVPKLFHELRGDLDWIVMKCLEKDRQRRYETANGLASDIQRFLGDEPVVARPPSRLYRLRKSVRRNRLAYAAAAVVLGTLVVGVLVCAWQAVRATRAEHRALAEATKSTQVAGFLKRMLKGVGPAVAKGRDRTMLREILDETAQSVGKELTNQPAVQAELRMVLARTYDDIGEWTNALVMAREALRLRRDLFGEDDLDVAEAHSVCGAVLLYQGNLSEAELHHRKALEIRAKLRGTNDQSVAECLMNVGVVLWQQGKLPEAENQITNALRILRQLSTNENAAIAMALKNLGGVLLAQGRLPEAEEVVRKVLEIQQRIFGENDPLLISALNNLAGVLWGQDKPEQAEPYLRRAVELSRKLHGNTHPALAAALMNLGGVLGALSRPAESEKAAREALEIQIKTVGSNHLDVAGTWYHLGMALQEQGKLDQAEEALRQAVTVQRKHPDAPRPAFATTLRDLGDLLRKRGELAEAEALQTAALQYVRSTLPPDDLELADSLTSLACTMVAQNKFQEAEKQARDSLAIREKKTPADWITSQVRTLLGLALVGQKKFDAAAPVLDSGYNGIKTNWSGMRPLDRSTVIGLMEKLGQLYESAGKPEKASEWRQKVAELKAAEPRKPAPATP